MMHEKRTERRPQASLNLTTPQRGDPDFRLLRVPARVEASPQLSMTATARHYSRYFGRLSSCFPDSVQAQRKEGCKRRGLEERDVCSAADGVVDIDPQ
jgi:hypothetical protein